ncbi:MAG: ketopantoate reductase family protein [Gammaproteobacteria bacterium]|nr:MAG: ketopantoate reductase family protein [Gammaproteobacteria bacterium]
MGKRIVVVGAGAVGAYVGGYLARAGEDVTLIDPWPAHVEKMRADGLSLEGLSEDECFSTPVQTMHITEVQDLARSGPVDIAFVCMKSYDTEWATMLIRDYLAPAGYVVSLQNCINENRIAAIVGWGKTIGCIASQIAVELVRPGLVRRGVPRGGSDYTIFRVGEAHGGITARVEEIAALLCHIDSSKTTSNLWGERWSKLVANAMRNGLSAATGLSNNACDREPATRWLCIRTAAEAVRVGLAQGYQLEAIYKVAPERWLAAAADDGAVRGEVEAEMEASAASRAESMRPSMGQDIFKGRRTEIDFINGLVVERGAEFGIATPVNAAMVDAVKRVEYGRVEASLDNVRDI